MPDSLVPEESKAPAPVQPSRGARLLGGLMLFWSVGLVSCQSLFFL